MKQRNLNVNKKLTKRMVAAKAKKVLKALKKNEVPPDRGFLFHNLLSQIPR